MVVECVGGGHHGQRTTLPPLLETVSWGRLRLPVIEEPCRCVGYWIYALWGELALAVYYEPPPLHALSPNYTHPES